MTLPRGPPEGAHLGAQPFISPSTLGHVIIENPNRRDSIMIPATSLLLMALTLLAMTVEGRGPHHPRGEAVVKHVHYRPTKSVQQSSESSDNKLLEDSQLLHDVQHLEEHLEEPDFDQMSDEELEFYYFQVHDSDKNAKLDGLEVLQAILHTTHHYDKEEDDGQVQDDFAYYVDLIDHALEEDDSDGDGYLSYPEYATGRKRAKIIERNNQKSVEII